MPYKWTPSEDAYLISIADGKSYQEMSDAFTIFYGYPRRSRIACERRCKYLGIKNTYTIPWTKEEDFFLKQNANDISFKELSEKLNEIYGYFRRTEFACQRRCTKLGITNGRDTKFKSGKRKEQKKIYLHCPLPIGSIRITKTKGTSIAYIKVSDDINNKKSKGHSIGNSKNWYPYGRYIYEKAHGKLPKDFCIVHLDGDPLNNDISNLEAVSKSVFVDLTRNKLHYKNPEIMKAAILIAKLDNSLYENKEET